MAKTFNFISPGAAATGALADYLTQLEARRRQQMLDDLTRRKADQDVQMAMEDLALKGR